MYRRLYDLLTAIQMHGGGKARAAVFFAAFAFFLAQLCVNVSFRFTSLQSVFHITKGKKRVDSGAFKHSFLITTVSFLTFSSIFSTKDRGKRQCRLFTEQRLSETVTMHRQKQTG